MQTVKKTVFASINKPDKKKLFYTVIVISHQNIHCFVVICQTIQCKLYVNQISRIH